MNSEFITYYTAPSHSVVATRRRNYRAIGYVTMKKVVYNKHIQIWSGAHVNRIVHMQQQQMHNIEYKYFDMAMTMAGENFRIKNVL